MAEFITWWAGGWTGTLPDPPAHSLAHSLGPPREWHHFLWVFSVPDLSYLPCAHARELHWRREDLKVLSSDFHWDLFQVKRHRFDDCLAGCWVTLGKVPSRLWSFLVSACEQGSWWPAFGGMWILFPRGEGRGRDSVPEYPPEPHTLQTQVYLTYKGSVRKQTSVPAQHWCPLILLITPWFSFFLNINLFLAVIGLCCCVQAFSSCSEQGLLFVVGQGLLTVLVSLVAQHKL